MNEYATKLDLERPTYNIVEQEELLPLFVTSLAFNVASCTGDAPRKKKEVEQLAGCPVIFSILGILLCMFYYIFWIDFRFYVVAN